MNTKLFIALVFTVTMSISILAQRPPRPEGPPGMGAPPREGQMRPGDGPRDARPPRDDWMKRLDANRDGKLDASELRAAIDVSFTEFDKNGNGSIESVEIPRRPLDVGPGQMPPNERGERPKGPPMTQNIRPGAPPSGQGERPSVAPISPDGKKMLPPFFFADRATDGLSISRAEFERIVQGVFNEMDKDQDGFISREESRPPRRPGDAQRPPEGPPPPPNAKFIAAELRFGDKLVKGQPFSAETVIEDTRRLYDGTTVTKQNRGAFYRDGSGRTRREQPMGMLGVVSVAGSDGKPQMLVFINDFATRTQYFLDTNNKVARKQGIGGPPPGEPGIPSDAKTESLGTKTIEGVQTEGTRVTFEIPAGRVGNDKPMQVVTETWFSSELQMIVMSRHLDPLAGEHVFRLVNIRRAEPAAEFFAIPSGFKVETPRNRPPEML